MAEPGIDGLVRFEECQRVGLVVEVPEEWVRPDLPDEFDPISITPASASLQFTLMDCPRFIENQLVGQGVRLFVTKLLVAPAEPAWAEWSPAFYTLQAYVDGTPGNGQWAGYAGLAEQATISLAQVPAADHEVRTVVVEGKEGVRYEFSYPWYSGNTYSTALLADVWWKEGTSFRKAVSEATASTPEETQGLGPSTILLEGDSAARRILQGAESAPGLLQFFNTYNDEWKVNATLFKTE